MEVCTGNEICTVLEYYTALSGTSLPTFWENLSFLSSRVEKSKKKSKKTAKLSFCLIRDITCTR
jgi:hypothetical protein